ncbi:synaptonemal complex central element protein 3 [Spea bombifrons]|uniref:synaptonemal complex central element protein 3 n=1 Tax=Spea bombifrons TaxID=233779 RepID=UPI00234BC35E|nr:synaptonemal complex central element protein 3 [Spea bombifrons]
MTESNPNTDSYDDVSKMLQDLNKDLKNMLEEVENISAQATWMAFDMVVIRTNPTLAESMKRLEDAFIKCKEEVEKKWREMLDKPKNNT